MQSIHKFLAKLTTGERQRVRDVMHLIVSGQIDHLDIRKLSGYTDTFRVRVGKVRIIYRNLGDRSIITKVVWRNDNTYRDF